jgi:hypothetical protein
MAFETASTNLVVELGIVMALLLGWQVTLAEFAGGAIMILAVALGFRARSGRGNGKGTRRGTCPCVPREVCPGGCSPGRV